MTEEDAVLAGELALGVLEGDERANALRQSLADPAFAAMVARWREHFALLHAEAPAAAVPKAIEQRVMASITPRRDRVSRWRTLAFVTSAIAASLAMVLVLRPGKVAPAPVVVPPSMLVAALGGSGATASEKPIGALYDPHIGGIVLVGGAPIPAARAGELWVIAPGKAPLAIGLIDGGDHIRLRVDNAARPELAAGATLAISIEPIGGSPTGQPTGPVVASGTLAAT